MKRLATLFLAALLAACVGGCCDTGCNSSDYGVSPCQPSVQDGGIGWR